MSICIQFSRQHIIPEMRSRTLDGVHIVFSSVIPLDTTPETTEIWKVARMFGARCHTELNEFTTHVVAAKVRFFRIINVFFFP